MAFSQATEWWWGRNKVYNCSAYSDLPTVDYGLAFQTGDLCFNIAPTVGQPGYWQATVSGNNITWAAGPIIGTNTSRTSAVATTLAATDSVLILTDASANALTLPVASTVPAFFGYRIVNTGAGTVTITPAAGGTVNAASTATLATNTSVNLMAISATAWVTY